MIGAMLDIWAMALPRIPDTSPSWYVTQKKQPQCPVCGCSNYTEEFRSADDGDDNVHVANYACGFSTYDGLRWDRCRSGDRVVRQRVTLADWWRGYVDVTIPKELRK